jgi:NADH-quinone oxidoreductase subunit J
MSAVFYIAAAVAIVSTVMVITRLNAVHALLYMIVSFLAVALIFFVLGAPFIAALEVIVYAGAIMVLFVFVVMLLNLGPHTTNQERVWTSPRIWWGPSLLALILVTELIYVLHTRGQGIGGSTVVEPKEVSLALFGPYVLAAELASMLLLSGLIGAFHLARRDDTARGGPQA